MSEVKASDDKVAQETLVWDPLLRIFHWLLVACFAVTLFGARGDTLAHNCAGYIAGALVGFRVLWGLVGPPHARFRDFVPSPTVLLRFLADLVLLRERRYLGHNPAGALMIVGLLSITLLIATTGWLMTTDAFYGVRWIQDVHESAANLALAMIIVHVTGVVFTSLRHKENLVRSMITGKKRVQRNLAA